MTQDALRHFSISAVILTLEKRYTAICEGRKISLSCFLRGQAVSRWIDGQPTNGRAVPLYLLPAMLSAAFSMRAITSVGSFSNMASAYRSADGADTIPL